jgi:nitrogen fixation protein NifU and related proteins
MDRQQYIEEILDYFQHPRNRGRMEDADVQLGGGNPGCGDLITVYLKLSDDGTTVEKASFEGEGCTISQAGGSMIAEMIEGMTVAEIEELGAHTMRELMGDDVVNTRVRCATLGLGTVQAALEERKRTISRAAVAAHTAASNP